MISVYETLEQKNQNALFSHQAKETSQKNESCSLTCSLASFYNIHTQWFLLNFIWHVKKCCNHLYHLILMSNTKQSLLFFRMQKHPSASTNQQSTIVTMMLEEKALVFF